MDNRSPSANGKPFYECDEKFGGAAGSCRWERISWYGFAVGHRGADVVDISSRYKARDL